VLAAVSNSLLELLQIELMLAPELMNSPAEARATNAISNVYSIKSWPRSSFQNWFMKFNMEISSSGNLDCSLTDASRYHSPYDPREQTTLPLVIDYS
jgi:type IV secretory pathway VirB4 component